MTMTEYLSNLAHVRAERYPPELISAWPPINEQKQVVFLGSFSWTLPHQPQRFIMGKTCVNLFGTPQTPTEITRDYLDVKYPKPLRATLDQLREVERHRAFPALAYPVMHDNAVYIDLKSAYWSILKIVGWDADYYPGKFLGVRSSVLDFPLPSNKPARSALVTAGLGGKMQMWTGDKLIFRDLGNRHKNLVLWALVQDVLHGVAADMVDAGAFYVHTDGYMLPYSNLRLAFEVADKWGLSVGVKAAGLADVRGVGVYRIGEFETKRYAEGYYTHFARIEPRFREWLSGKIRFHSERI